MIMTPIQMMWDIMKSSGIELKHIFKRYHSETGKESFYVVLFSNITDTAKVQGDGKTLMRKALCDINLIAKCDGSKSNDALNSNRKLIDEVLKSKSISYSFHDNGYNGERSEMIWEFYLDYVD